MDIILKVLKKICFSQVVAIEQDSTYKSYQLSVVK